MQNKKIIANEHVLLSIPLDMLITAGIEENSVIEIYVDNDKLIIRQAIDLSDFECEGDCDNCPLDEHGCPFEERQVKDTLCPECRAKLIKRGERHD